MADERDELGQATRNRILLLYRNTVSGSWAAPPDQTASFLWSEVHDSLQYLHGRASLSGAMSDMVVASPATVLQDIELFLQECSTAEFLDFIELSFKGHYPPRAQGDSKAVIDAINELFRADDAPYYLTDFETVVEDATTGPLPGIPPAPGMKVERVTSYPMIVRIEEDVVYKEAVAPSLTILSGKQYAAPNAEFRSALEHYRNGKFRESLTDCGSALESVLKVICDEHGWPYQQTDTLGDLLDNAGPRLGLEPALKERSKVVATLRNKFSSSHGGGTSARAPERYLVQYAITTTAATIVLIVTIADNKKPSS